jgi:hypothetical protein
MAKKGRGRPPRPPRTDPSEIAANRKRLDENIEHRMTATFRPPPPDPIAQVWSRDALNEMKSSKILRAPDGKIEDPSLLLGMGGIARAADRRREIEKNVARWRAFRTAADRLVGAGQWSPAEADERMDRIGFLPHALADAVSRGEISEEGLTDEQVDRYWPVPKKSTSAPRTLPKTAEGEETPRRRSKEPDFNTIASRVLPSIPQWIRDAAFDSILFLFDEAPESMRPKIENIKPELMNVREQLMSPDLPPRLAKRAAALWDIIRCATWAEGDIRDPNGVRPALIHYANVRERMKEFASNCAKDQEGRVKIPRDIALRLFVPAFNATHADQRRCLECGSVFALRNDHERMTMRFCGGTKKCGKKVSSRKAKAAARAAGDAYTKVRETEKGDLPLDRAERELAAGVDVEDFMLNLIDASRRVRDKK